MNVFGIGLPEIAVIGAIALLVFGPKRLPEIGRTLGKTLKGFQAASSEFEREIQKAMSEEDIVEEQAVQNSTNKTSISHEEPQNNDLTSSSS